MSNINREQVIEQFENFRDRLVCPKCKPTDHEQGMLDGISYCIHALKLMDEADTMTQLTLEAWIGDSE